MVVAAPHVTMAARRLKAHGGARWLTSHRSNGWRRRTAIYLAVFTTTAPHGTVHASVVNAAVTVDPVDGSPAVGLVAAGNSKKLRLLRRDPRATAVFKSGYEWAAVSGRVRLVGPDGGGEPGLPVASVIRSVYRAAGGDHDDWDEFDRVMAAERRCAVFVSVERITSNPSS